MPSCVFIPAVGEGILHILEKSSVIQVFPPLSYICEVVSLPLHLLKDSCIQPIVLMVPTTWRILTSYLYRIYPHPPHLLQAFVQMAGPINPKALERCHLSSIFCEYLKDTWILSSPYIFPRMSNSHLPLLCVCIVLSFCHFVVCADLCHHHCNQDTKPLHYHKDLSCFLSILIPTHHSPPSLTPGPHQSVFHLCDVILRLIYM